MKISEFARATNVSVETVRYYQREQLLSTPSNQSGIRQYTQAHVEQIQFIKNAKLAGFSLNEIKQLGVYDALEDRKTILALSEQKKRELSEKINELHSAITFLQSLMNECRSSEEDLCPILEGLKHKQL